MPFAAAVTAGLAGKPKTLPTAYLYDARGSALFEDITQLDAYYQTRTEMRFLTAKPVIYVANVDEDSLADGNDYVTAARAIAAGVYAPVRTALVTFVHAHPFQASVSSPWSW